MCLRDRGRGGTIFRVNGADAEVDVVGGYPVNLVHIFEPMVDSDEEELVENFMSNGLVREE